ncbi:growth hormone secretagogue receptor type 1-like [Lineus longissimus]|uniref:growth hormone secretagogue receptor type 1-like n=1 Tax=Lineus longissimus TaxID=88925 RepID=UPI00315DF4C6
MTEALQSVLTKKQQGEYYSLETLMDRGHWEAFIAFAFVAYVGPVIIAMGTIFNIATVTVVSSGRIGHVSTRILLIVLSLSDLLVLYVGCLDQVLSQAYDIRLRRISDAMCKVSIFLMEFTLMVSSWSVLLLTLERCICVTFPLKAQFICSKRRTYFVVVGVFILLFALNSHCLIFMKVGIYPGEGVWCDAGRADAPYFTFYYTAWGIIRVVMYAAIPFIVITICNVFIMFKLLRNMRRRMKMQNTQAQKDLTGITFMLVVVSVVFVILALPNQVFYAIEPIFFPDLSESEQQAALGFLLGQSSRTMTYSNHAINFILYCISGSQFRAVFFDQMKQLRLKLFYHGN